MLKMKHLFMVAIFCLWATHGFAEIVSPYKLQFNIPIETSNHDFSVATGWNHIVESYENGYVRYTYHATGGIDNSEYLEIGSQTMIDWSDGSEHPLNDLLVTPPVGGKISLWVKTTRLNEKAGVKFFYVKQSGGQYAMGEEIKVSLPALSMNEFQKVELPAVPAGTLIGIRGYSVAIDDFEAEQADVTLKKALKITQVTWKGGQFVDCDASGSFKVSYMATFQNTGDITIATNFPDYKFSLLAGEGQKTVATSNGKKQLSPGDVDSVLLEATLNIKDYHDHVPLAVREHITETKVSVKSVKPIIYAPQFSLTGAYGTTPLATGNRLEYGTSKEAVKLKLLLRNDGAQSQEITSISTTAGFACSLKAPLSVPPHNNIPIIIEMEADGKAEKHGTFQLKGANGVDIALRLHGFSVGANECLINFENEIMPEGFSTPSNWHVTNYPNTIYCINNKYCASTSSSTPVKLITPLMRFAKGTTYTFEVAKVNNESFMNVYYSQDRQEWELARSISGSEMGDSVVSSGWLGNNYAFKRFSLKNMPAGNYYIAFEAGNAHLDNLVGGEIIPAEHDAYIDQPLIPEKGKVNTSMNVSATLCNIMNHKMDDGAFTLGFFLNNTLVCQKNIPALEARESKLVRFDVKPHLSGTLNAHFACMMNDKVIATSPVVKIEISPESNQQEIVTSNFTWQQEEAPINAFIYQSESEAIYLPSEVQMLPGTKITRLIYYGNNVGQDLPIQLQVWMGNSTDSLFKAPYRFTPKEKMTSVFQGNAIVKKAGTPEQHKPILTIELEQPFVYTGQNLVIYLRHKAQEGSRSFFQSNANTKGRTIARRHDTNLELADIVTCAHPVAHIGFEIEAATMSGTVTNQSTGNPLSAARVSLKSKDGVLYQCFTNAQGRYSMPIYQRAKKYDLDISREGYFPYRMRAVDFSALTFALNAALKEANGFYIDSVEVAQKSMRNHPLPVSFYATNYLSKPISAQDYTAKVLLDGKEAGTIATMNVDARGFCQGSTELHPTRAGQFALQVELQLKDGTTALSEPLYITIEDESLNSPVQIGKACALATNTPLDMVFKKSQTETIYPDSIIDLRAGDVLHSIGFKGYVPVNTSYTAHITAWLENTDQQGFNQPFTPRDTAAMVKIFDGNVLIETAGSEKAPVTLFNFPIKGGMVYQGKGLRLVLLSQAEQFSRVNFVADNTLTQHSYVRNTDSDTFGPSWSLAGNWSSNMVPVAYLIVDKSKMITGRVTDENTGKGLQGVQVQLSSGHVKYETTTNAQGQYDLKVVQSLLDYNVNFALKGYMKEEVAVSFNNGDVLLNMQLKVDPTSALNANPISNLRVEGVEGAIVLHAGCSTHVDIYNATGQLVSKLYMKSGEKRVALPSGIYIVNQQKVRVK